MDMKYYHNLYISESLCPKIKDIVEKLENGKIQFNKYLIALTKNEVNHLEFFDSVLLLQQIFLKDEIFVVGIAEGYTGALELVEKITQEVYTETQGTNIRNYIICQQKEFEERDV